MKLNGWQRLWIFSSILIGCGSFGIGVVVFPTSGWAEGQYLERLAELDSDEVKVESPTYIPAKKPNPWNKYADAAGRTPVSRATVEEARAIATAKHNQYLTELKEQQTTVTFIAIGAWAALSGIMYFLGWFVAWVIRGFKADKAKP